MPVLTCLSTIMDSNEKTAEALDDDLDANKISQHSSSSTRPEALPRWSRLSVDSEYYDMTNKNRGIALILNHGEFKNKKLRPRPGTENDCKKIEKCLIDLDFHTIVRNDLHYNELKDQLELISELDHTDNDCLIVVVMSHGEKGVLHAKDKKFPVEELWEPFLGENCPSLVGKPKLFFVQACRGEQLDQGVMAFRAAAASFDFTDALPEKENYTIPTTADILVMYSTYDGHYSWRNPQNGSWFIQALSRELNEHGKVKDLLTILTGVSRRVAYEYQSNVPGNEKMHAMKQMPSIVSMLTKVLYFTKKARVDDRIA